ncbi:hypothetical protein N7493_009677 [Penicillium malachiteum]|uniref:Uncharacterized protein n=1 Tax=Penicillium malachiteum TaxID=1324776 RepID=A0AAD6HES0_9EURO|nr:hypothetical protein N7493_009677 [Penicillium malachiteum]
MANKGWGQALQNFTDQFPVVNNKTILFIFLTDFTNEEENAFMKDIRLQYTKNDYEIKAWKPSRRMLGSLAVQGTHRDSQANIYALAMFAYRSGFQVSGLPELDNVETKPATIFIVVDELSKRCWTNTHRVGERGSISLIVVQVKSDPDPAEYSYPYYFTIPRGLRVEAARYNDPSLWQDSDSDNDSSNQSSSSKSRLLNSMAEFQHGFHMAKYDENDEDKYLDDFWDGRMGSWGDEDWSMFIYDPDQRPFASACEPSSTKNETWRVLSPYLPPELVSRTISFTAADPSTEKILWKKRQSDEHLHLFVMFPTTEDELGETSLIIHDLLKQQPEDSPKTAELIPLHRHQMRSRRDISTFWEAYRQREPDERLHSPFLNLLLHPIKGPSESPSHFAVVRDLKNMPLAIMEINFMEMCLPQLKRKQDSVLKWKPHPVDKVELLHHPDQPCYEVCPPWRGARSSDTWSRWISVFYLTKRFTKEEDSYLRNSIEELREEEAAWFAEGVSIENRKKMRGVCYVPWEHEEDGDMSDMWEILLKVYRHQGLGTKCQRLFFIDRESFNDRRLIIIEAYFYLAGRQVQSRSNLLQGLEAPLLAGFRHFRIPAIDAHMKLHGLSNRSIVIEDLEEFDDDGYDEEDGDEDEYDDDDHDEDTEFIRPSWPRFRDLPPTNPFRPDWEEPTTIPVWEAFNVMGGGPNQAPEIGTNP